MKKGILASSGHVSTTVPIHPMNANEMHEEIVIWGLHKDVTWYFEQILEATPHKVANNKLSVSL